MGILDRFSLEGKRALITGAGRGLGAQMAQALAEAGARVALVARSEDQVLAAAARIGANAAPVPADVSDPATFPALIDRVEESLDGPVDVVVHAAGVQHREVAVTFDLDAWDRVIAVNLTAPFFLSQQIGARQIDAGRPGSHVFIGSLASRVGLPGVAAYTASKSGVYGVARTLALEWARLGIRVNTIGPGYVHTELTNALFEDVERRESLQARIPMGRFGQVEDLMGTVVYLASDASAYVTGQLLMVDGGWTAS